MIKHLLTTLCALALVTTGSIPALAAEADTGESARYYPISVEEYTYEEQNEPRINKVYQLSLSDDPSGIPRSDFVRNGRLYYLLDMTRKDEVGVDTKPHTETVTRPSDTSNMEEILQGLEAELEVTTEEGYIGVLRLDHTSVQVTTDGYATKTQPLSATRSYPNLSEADVSLVPKSIEDSGRTLTLADVQWQEAGGFYNAAATYTGTASSKYATGYTVTADYAGEVTKTTSGTVLYTAVFGLAEEQEAVTAIPQPAAEGGGFDWRWLLVLPAGAGVVGLVFLGRFLLQKYKSKKEWKEYNK